MPRLITFGCSHTFGAGLPDVYPEHSGIPSNMAWPKLLSEKLQYDLENKGISGAGNAEILYNILNFSFQPDDYCIIMWAHFIRFRHHVMAAGYEPTRKWIKPEFLTLEVMDFFKHTNAYNNFLAIHHAHTYLRHKNIKALSFIAEKEDYQEYEMPKFIEIPELILINHGKYRVDHALDDLHFGVNSHQKLSEILYKRIIA